MNLDQAYLSLRRETRAQGLHDRTTAIYGLYALLIGLGIALSYYVLTVIHDPVAQCLNAIYLAFVLVQAGLVAHDLTHDQVFASRRANAIAGSLTWALLIGISQSGWHAKHNAHHVHVNQNGHDPDLEMPFIFSSNQTKDGILVRLLRPYQHLWFFAALPLVYPSTVLRSVIHIVKHPSPVAGAELVLMVLHFWGFFAITLHFMPLPLALLFYLFHFATAGCYLSLVFAPNHKGEEVLPADRPVTWLNQITSTRNIVASKWIFLIFGGLNFQIEHHLFPSMSRFKSWQAQKLVKEFCARNGIPYHETTWGQSLREIYRTLKAASG